jgi:hypothetical protein
VTADPIDGGLQAVIKALDDVVAQSLDPANPLAREQLKLSVRYLGFVRRRLPLLAERDRAELQHYLALARELAPLAAGCGVAGVPALEPAIAAAARTLTDAGAGTEALRAATAALTADISVLVRAAAAAAGEQRRPIERAVTLASARLFDLQRAWYLPMGFEPDPERVPALPQALAATAGSGPTMPA